jgi:hypothetical protein
VDWQTFQKRIRAPSASELDELARMIVAARGFKTNRIAPELVRRVLAEPLPARVPPKTRPMDAVAATRALIFLKEAVDSRLDDETLVARWSEANQVLRDVNAYEWGSKERHAKLRAICDTAWQLQAIQAAVVGIRPPDDAGLDFMAVLALDGSEASADALMPHIHHAMTTGDGLTAFKRLEKYAADTPPMRAMFEKTKSLLGERSKQCPIHAVLRTLGIDVSTCDYSLWMGSREARSHVPIAQVNFSFDSQARPYIHLSIDAPMGETSWNDLNIRPDALGLGRPELADLPAYFASAAKKLFVNWSWDEASISSSLRGKKREAVLQWLRKPR